MVIWDEFTILHLSIVVALGILLFDLFLLLKNGHMTISRAYGRMCLERPWFAIGITAAICFLIWHLNT